MENSLLGSLDGDLNVNPIEFLTKIWGRLQSIRDADALACFSIRQDKDYDKLLATPNGSGSAFEFLKSPSRCRKRASSC